MHAELNNHSTPGLIGKQRTFIDLDLESEPGTNGCVLSGAKKPRSQRKPAAKATQATIDTLAIIEVLQGEVQRLEDRLKSLEALLRDVHERMVVGSVVKDYYTTQEVARRLGKRPYTVREWCRLGRVNGEKSHSGRGLDDEWRISHAELIRIENEGLLPVTRGRDVRSPNRLS